MRIKFCNILITLLILALPGLDYAVTGPGQAWQYYRVITLSPATPGTGFQVKITLTTATFGNPYTNILSNGNDLRFYDGSNNVCNYWIESFANNGTSYIWVKVPVSSTSSLYMFYGNSLASAASSGSNTFDFFDDFTNASFPGWTQNASGGSITQTGGTWVYLANTSTGGVSITNASPFTVSSSSWLFEIKNYETAYARNRFYVTTVSGGVSPTGWDYGYFWSGLDYTTAHSTSATLWNTAWSTNTNLLSANTVYLTQWLITDGSTYNWNTYLYSTFLTGGATIDNRTASVASTCRYISISVTETASTGTVIDWVRVRRYAASEPSGSFGSQIATVQVSITAHTDASCYRQPTGSATATVSGGTAPFGYSWNTTPPQTTSVSNSLPAGTYIVIVTDNIGLTASTSITINEPTPVTASASPLVNLICYNGSDGKITVTGSGGTPNYSFSINNGTDWTAGTTFYTFENLTAGSNYKIRVRDSNGCLSPLIP